MGALCVKVSKTSDQVSRVAGTHTSCAVLIRRSITFIGFVPSGYDSLTPITSDAPEFDSLSGAPPLSTSAWPGPDQCDNRGTDPAAPAAEISRPAAAQPRPAPADHRHIRLLQHQIWLLFRNLVTFLFQHCRIHSDGQEEEEVQEEGQAEEGVDQRPLRRAPTPRPIRLFLVTQRDRAHTVCTGIDGSECIEE